MAQRLLLFAGIALALELAVWFLGLGPRDAHYALAPFWIVPLFWARRRFPAASVFPPRWMGDVRPGWATAALTLFFGLAWAVALTRMFLAFRFSAYDLGIYSSVAFNTAHGRPFFPPFSK